MEVILKSGTQKEVDDLQEQLDEAHTEISNLKAYIQLKESEILFLKEKVSNLVGEFDHQPLLLLQPSNCCFVIDNQLRNNLVRQYSTS